MMNKSEFLNEISSMSRQQISELFDRSKTRTKWLYPVILLRSAKNDSEDKRITTKKKGDE